LPLSGDRKKSMLEWMYKLKKKRKERNKNIKEVHAIYCHYKHKSKVAYPNTIFAYMLFYGTWKIYSQSKKIFFKFIVQLIKIIKLCNCDFKKKKTKDIFIFIIICAAKQAIGFFFDKIVIIVVSEMVLSAGNVIISKIMSEHVSCAYRRTGATGVCRCFCL